MLSRHRREISQLQNNKIELKKAAVKGGKAHEQKARKKQVEEEISKLSANLKEKHAQELSSLKLQTRNELKKNNLDNFAKAMATVSLGYNTLP